MGHDYQTLEVVPKPCRFQMEDAYHIEASAPTPTTIHIKTRHHG